MWVGGRSEFSIYGDMRFACRLRAECARDRLSKPEQKDQETVFTTFTYCRVERIYEPGLRLKLLRIGPERRIMLRSHSPVKSKGAERVSAMVKLNVSQIMKFFDRGQSHYHSGFAGQRITLVGVMDLAPAQSAARKERAAAFIVPALEHRRRARSTMEFAYGFGGAPLFEIYRGFSAGELSREYGFYQVVDLNKLRAPIWYWESTRFFPETNSRFVYKLRTRQGKRDGFWKAFLLLFF